MLAKCDFEPFIWYKMHAKLRTNHDYFSIVNNFRKSVGDYKTNDMCFIFLFHLQIHSKAWAYYRLVSSKI